MRKPVVGLTGILGCGKSTASHILADLGAAIVDMDAAGRWVVENDACVQQKIRFTFGDDVFDQHGQLLRKKLGDIVFRSQEALTTLNGIVHPAMLDRVRFLINKEKSNVARHYIIVDAALIFELGFNHECDATVCITSPLHVCLQRAEAKGLTQAQALDRINSQLPQEVKAARADVVIANDSTLDELKIRLKEFHLWVLNTLKE